MRIAIWWQQESWGGVDTHLASLLRAWPDPTDEFVIFHNRANPGLQRIRATLGGARGVATVAFPEWQSGSVGLLKKALEYFLLPVNFLLWTRRARRLLATHGPFDALISDNGSYPGAWTSLAALQAADHLAITKRMLLVHHSAGSYGVFRQTFEQLLDRGVARWATDLVAVSRATRESLIRVRFFNTERNPIRVIHNGVGLKSFEVRDFEFRARWGVKPDDFVIGMVGRIERYKGHEDLLCAIAEIAEALREKVRLVVIGSGSDMERERLLHIAQSLGLAQRIHFTGFLEEDSVFLIRQFDLLAMVTKDFEGFGLSIAEAMMAGTPVLATSVGGVPEFVNSDVGVLVPPESPLEIAAALERIMSDAKGTAVRATRAREHIAQFSDVRMAQRFWRLLSL
jgi:glycosyltransferase involved in cell wall biosynthesis